MALQNDYLYICLHLLLIKLCYAVNKIQQEADKLRTNVNIDSRAVFPVNGISAILLLLSQSLWELDVHTAVEFIATKDHC